MAASFITTARPTSMDDAKKHLENCWGLYVFGIIFVGGYLSLAIYHNRPEQWYKNLSYSLDCVLGKYQEKFVDRQLY